MRGPHDRHAGGHRVPRPTKASVPGRGYRTGVRGVIALRACSRRRGRERRSFHETPHGVLSVTQQVSGRPGRHVGVGSRHAAWRGGRWSREALSHFAWTDGKTVGRACGVPRRAWHRAVRGPRGGERPVPAAGASGSSSSSARRAGAGGAGAVEGDAEGEHPEGMKAFTCEKNRGKRHEPDKSAVHATR